MPACAVVGAGAVGCFFGAMLARAGADVVLIGREKPMHAIAANGLSIVGRTGTIVQPMRTATDLEAARDAHLVLLCTKTTDTVATASALDRLLAPQAVLVSLQNGVDNAARIHAATGRRALSAAVYVAVEITAPGVLAHHGRGDLALGAGNEPEDPAAGPIDARVAQVAGWFEAAGVPCRQSPDIRVELWTKLAMNCAVNAISALGQVPYGKMAERAEIRAMIAGLVNETVMVARAEGIALPAQDYVTAAFRLIDSMPGQYSSTAQDIRRSKPTEIDALNGHVARLADTHGLDTPLNRWLAALVRLRESAVA